LRNELGGASFYYWKGRGEKGNRGDKLPCIVGDGGGWDGIRDNLINGKIRAV